MSTEEEKTEKNQMFFVFAQRAEREEFVGEDEKHPKVSIAYVNHRGHRTYREILPAYLWFGTTRFHKTPCWMVRAWDPEKKDWRDFDTRFFEQWLPEKGGQFFSLYLKGSVDSVLHFHIVQRTKPVGDVWEGTVFDEDSEEVFGSFLHPKLKEHRNQYFEKMKKEVFEDS